MAFSVVQHAAGTVKTSDASGNTTTTAWPGNTGAGNLLVASLVFNGNATVTSGTSGWTQAITKTNGTTEQTEIWYKANSAGSDASPVFVVKASVKYLVNIAEVSGVATSSPLDKTGTASGSNISTLAVATSTTTTSGSEFVYAGMGLRNASNVVGPFNWNASTAGGSAVFGADIDQVNCATGVGAVGLAHAWATSGSSGTSPSITGNIASTSVNVTLAFTIATFTAGSTTLSVNKSDSITVTESVATNPESYVSKSDSSTISESTAFSDLGIQFDATSNSGYQAASSSYNWNHTVGTYNNRILIVTVGMLSATNSVSSITYNSVNLTKLRADTSVSTTVRTEIWYLVAPATGTHSIAVALGVSSVSGSVASSYLGVDQLSPFDAQNGTTGITGGGGGSATVSTTTDINMAWVVNIIATTDTAITVASGQRERANITGAVGSAAQSDQGPKTPAGSVTSQWDNIAALTTWTMSTAALMPVEDDAVVSDSTTVTESVKVELQSFISKSDTASTSESLVVTLVSDVNLSDSSTITESIAQLLESNINVSDSATITESTVLLIPTLFVTVADSATITESIGRLLESVVNVSDSATITESLVKVLESNIVTSDSATITENIVRLLESNINKSESITVTENVLKLLESSISVSESTTLTESVGRLLESSITVSDSATVTESLTELITSFVNVSDSSTITDSPTVSTGGAIPTLTVNVSDSITTSENAQLMMELYINKSDSSTLSESLTVTVMPVDLGVIVTPGIQQIGGVRIV